MENFVVEILRELGFPGFFIIGALVVYYLLKHSYEANLLAIEDYRSGKYQGTQDTWDLDGKIGDPKTDADVNEKLETRFRGHPAMRRRADAIYLSQFFQLRRDVSRATGLVNRFFGDALESSPPPILSSRAFMFSLGFATLYPFIMLSIATLWGWHAAPDVAKYLISPDPAVPGNFIELKPEQFAGLLAYDFLLIATIVTFLWWQWPISGGKEYRPVDPKTWVRTVFIVLGIAAALYLVLVDLRAFAIIPAALVAVLVQGPLAAVIGVLSALAYVTMMTFDGAGYRLDGFLEYTAASLVAAIVILFAANLLVGKSAEYHFEDIGDETSFSSRYSVGEAVVVVLLIVLCLMTIALSARSEQSIVRTLGLLFVLLPLVNAVFDFVSVQVTRYCFWKMTSARQKRTVAGFLILDIIIAILLSAFVVAVCVFAILAFYGVTDVEKMNEQDFGAHLVRELQNPTGSDYAFWIYFMLFSTVIPTVIHSMTIIYAIARDISPAINMIVFDTLFTRLDDTDNLRAFAWRLTLMQAWDDVISAFAFVLLCAGLWFFVVPWVAPAFITYVGQIVSLVGSLGSSGPVATM